MNSIVRLISISLFVGSWLNAGAVAWGQENARAQEKYEVPAEETANGAIKNMLGRLGSKQAKERLNHLLEKGTPAEKARFLITGWYIAEPPFPDPGRQCQVVCEVVDCGTDGERPRLCRICFQQCS